MALVKTARSISCQTLPTMSSLWHSVFIAHQQFSWVPPIAYRRKRAFPNLFRSWAFYEFLFRLHAVKYCWNLNYLKKMVKWADRIMIPNIWDTLFIQLHKIWKLALDCLVRTISSVKTVRISLATWRQKEKTFPGSTCSDDCFNVLFRKFKISFQVNI